MMPSKLALRWPRGALAQLVLAGVLVGALLVLFVDPGIARWARDLPPAWTVPATLVASLGSPVWYLTALVLIALLFRQMSLGGADPLRRRPLADGSRAALAGLLSVLLAGAASLLLAGAFGRPDPEVLGLPEAGTWRPFAFDFRTASLPSAYAAMLLALAFSLAYFLPSRLGLLLAAATALCFTRVILSESYLSDILAGGLLGAGGAHLILRMGQKKGWLPEAGSGRHARMRRACEQQLTGVVRVDGGGRSPRVGMVMTYAVVLLLAAAALFVAIPEIDLAVSGWFHRPGEGFPDTASLAMLRSLVKVAIYLPLYTSLVLLAVWLANPWAMRISARLPLFVVSAYLLGPFLLVNEVLKNNWGRARPAEVDAFGGEAAFTPAVLPAAQCDDNCSFVSGEGSGIVTAALVVGLIFWPRIRQSLFWKAVLLALPALGMSLRIITGRHFLSDTLIGALLCVLIVLFLYEYFGVRQSRAALTAANLKHDLKSARRGVAWVLPRRRGADRA